MLQSRAFAGAALLVALALRLAAQEPPYKFRTTVTGAPLYTFGTTVATNGGFRGEIYYIEPGSEKLPNFSRLKPVGTIYTAYLCVPPRSFDEGFPGITDRFEWFAIDYTGRFWISDPGYIVSRWPLTMAPFCISTTRRLSAMTSSTRPWKRMAK